MYLFKIVEKMLEHHEEVELKKDNNNISPHKSYKDDVPLFKDNSKKGSYPTKNKGVYNKNNSDSKDDFSSNNNVQNIAYCLFSNTGESFLAMHGKIKKTIYLNGISHQNKYSTESKAAKEFINEQIKQKNVFVSIVAEKDDGSLVADVFLDKEKTQSLNQMLIERGIHQSFYQPKPSYQQINKEIQHEQQNKKDNVLTNTNTLKEKTIKDNNLIENKDEKLVQDYKTPTPKNSHDHIIGYIKKYGSAPYLNQPSNNQSFFLTISHNDTETTKWGVNLKKTISTSNAKVGDYIELKKSGVDNKTGNSYANLWEINILEDIHQRHIKENGPPHIEDEILIEQQVSVEDWEQENIDFTNIPTYDLDNIPIEIPEELFNDIPFFDDFPNSNDNLISPPVSQVNIIEDKSDYHSIETPVQKNNISNTSADAFDDILSEIDYTPSAKKIFPK